jgi:hypothetical protein
MPINKAIAAGPMVTCWLMIQSTTIRLEAAGCPHSNNIVSRLINSAVHIIKLGTSPMLRVRVYRTYTGETWSVGLASSIFWQWLQCRHLEDTPSARAFMTS